MLLTPLVRTHLSEGREKADTRYFKVYMLFGPEIQFLGVNHEEGIEIVHKDLNIRKLDAVLIPAKKLGVV